MPPESWSNIALLSKSHSILSPAVVKVPHMVCGILPALE
jgi:hypothetical protein